jgi:hypothetical protein
MAIWGTSCLGGKGDYHKALPKSQEWGRAAASFFATMKLDFGFQAAPFPLGTKITKLALLVDFSSKLSRFEQLWPRLSFFWKINVGSLQN